MDYKTLLIENTVLKAQLAGKYTPADLNQVVKALLSDHVLLSFEADELDQNSVNRALARLATSEPQLFKKDGAGQHHSAQELLKTKALEMMGIKQA